MDADAITLAIAIWGAVLASITFGWNLYRDLSDRGRLRVTCYMGAIVTSGKGVKDNLLIWSVVNTGRQSVMLTNIGGIFHGGSGFVVNTQQPLPKMLAPGEYFTDYTDHFEFLDPERLGALTALTSVGTTYAPRKQVEEVAEKIAALKAKQRSPTSEN